MKNTVEVNGSRETQEHREISIKAPNFGTASFKLIGIAPLVTSRFSAKAMEMMMGKMRLGSAAKKGKNRQARDFNEDFENAKHKSKQGWCGVPAGAFRNAMISACRIVGFKMTQAKLAVFVEADGIDEVDGMPLVKIHGEPRQHTMYARNQTGVCDIRVRPMWENWHINLKVRFDADLFTIEDVTNLLARAGLQVGIGEGRPDSRESAGLGWGMFRIAEKEEIK